MINRRGEKPGPQRGNRRRFPYEPRVVGGKLLMPAELQVVETVWPELRSKLPPKS
jgi:hypothetical protein